MTARTIALCLGLLALALISGALGFQYIAHLPPCEMCHWQRWPLIAAAIVAIPGAVALKGDARLLAGATIVLVGISGAIGFYQAGVEWHVFPGPAACTGAFHPFTGMGDLNAPGQVRCDAAAWRLSGISLAGYNAILSLGAAFFGAAMLARKAA
jgi:disulfide bond formation protein DsbB